MQELNPAAEEQGRSLPSDRTSHIAQLLSCTAAAVCALGRRCGQVAHV